MLALALTMSVLFWSAILTASSTVNVAPCTTVTPSMASATAKAPERIQPFVVMRLSPSPDTEIPRGGSPGHAVATSRPTESCSIGGLAPLGRDERQHGNEHHDHHVGAPDHPHRALAGRPGERGHTQDQHRQVPELERADPVQEEPQR